MKKLWAFSLLLPLLFLTGCPSNQYVIELTPRDGGVIERKLVFYREDGSNNYQSFPKPERAEIARLYPAESLEKNGEIYKVAGNFFGTMPRDVGGAGSYTNLKTSLGSAGFYLERFRGDDDLATRTTKRLRAADQLVDMIIGWSRMELGHERGYENLRRFLDKDFRNDARNLTMYGWMLRTSLATRSDTPEEFGVRYGQYLVERGYLKMEDMPDLFRALVSNDSGPWMKRIQRLVATKLGVSPGKPMPQSLAFLADGDSTQQSWKKYLMTTDAYRIKYRHWQKEKIVHEIGVAKVEVENLYSRGSHTNKIPAAPNQPSPSEVEEEVLTDMMDGIANALWETDDQLTVKLSLPFAPTHSNGKWDEARKQVVWESKLEQTDKNDGRVPAFCYASWNEPDEAAQKEHFGKVALRGDELLQYCLWRNGLSSAQADEWETLLTGLKPGNDLGTKIKGFYFSEEAAPKTNNSSSNRKTSDFVKELLNSAVDEHPQKNQASK